ncbi:MULTISPECIES: DUF5708 family protein [unclassified Streptomyces]|uniref:DUF5708 family protein n=1 Tax=unclassified Streptomyces TaxID=2593676 RepID=UPI000938E523|nr:DUF5708 family protein [Streptomyces sp. CB02400]OKK11776.1 hypothetical protein AMK33_10285 [Streptomyces sp. CB02400]
MNRASKNLLEGVVTLLVGLALWLFTGDVEVPVVTPAKVGIVLMCVGGAQTAWGLYGAARRSA